mgnify:CR=1 FL=1
MATHKDFLGNELQIDDYVVLAKYIGAEFYFARIIDLTDKMVRVDNFKNKYSQNHANNKRGKLHYSRECIKISEEQFMWMKLHA